MAAMFPGKKHRYESKLRYELCKSVGLDWKKFPLGAYDVDGTAIEQHVPVSGSLSSSFSASTSAAFPGDADSGSCSASVSPSPSSVVAASPDIELPVLDDSNHYPSDVRRMIHEYGEAYRERSRLHYKMISVGEGNSPENMDIRRNLLVRIKALSARMDVLFIAKDNYLRSRVLPDAGALWPPEKSASPLVEAAPLPDDPVELRRLKKNLQTYNVKDNNLLLYQSVSIQMEKHPMPQGPKRVGIEKRIRGRLRMIEAIDYKLVEHAG